MFRSWMWAWITGRAKAEIEAKYRTKLVLKLDKIDKEKMLKEPIGKCRPMSS